MVKKDLKELIMSLADIAEMNQRVKFKRIEKEVERAKRNTRIKENLDRFNKMLIYPNSEKLYNLKTNYLSNKYNLQYIY